MNTINCEPLVSQKACRPKGRILLIYTQRSGGSHLYELTEPLGLNSLAAFIEERGYAARVFSGPAHKAVIEVEREVSHNGLSAIGLYCDYENRSVVESFSCMAKNTWNVPVIVGGPQAIVLEKDFFEASRCDVVVRGEGEFPLFELMELFCRRRGSLAKIAGAVHIDSQGRLITVAPSAPIHDLDQLPVRSPGMDQGKGRCKGSLSLLTGRGCPFRCAFCYEGSVPGKVRLRSVGHVMAEIRQALQHNPGIKFIWFADDTFTLDVKRVESFCREISKLKKEHDFVWFCECHPGTMVRWPEMLDMMLEAGLVRMQIGIESGSASVLRYYRKKATLEQIESVVALSMKSGLPHLAGNMIIGGASENRRTFNDSKRFAARLLELGPGMVDITTTFFLPLPKTAISCNPAQFGLKIIDAQSITSRGDFAVVETEAFTREQITALRLEFTSHIQETMWRLYRERRIPKERILKDICLKQDYGLESSWYDRIYSERDAAAPGHLPSGQYATEHSDETRGAAFALPELDEKDLFQDTCGRRQLELSQGKRRSAEKRVGELRLIMSRSPDVKFVRVPGSDFTANRRYCSQISRALGKLKTEDDFAWCCTCSPDSIAGQANLVNEMVKNGLVRVELDMDDHSAYGAGHDALPVNNPDLESALDTCNRAGVAQTIINLAVHEVPRNPDQLHRAQEWIEAILTSAPGKSEIICKPILPEINESAREWLTIVQDQLYGHTIEVMRHLFIKRRISRKTMLSHFSIYHRYGVESLWLKGIFKCYGIVFNYYSLIADGAACSSQDIESEELNRWRPQRTMDLWLTIDFSKGYPKIGRHVLSPLEYELLLYSSGKLKLHQLLEISYAKYGHRYENFAAYRETAVAILEAFEEREWLVYCEL